MHHVIYKVTSNYSYQIAVNNCLQTVVEWKYGVSENGNTQAKYKYLKIVSLHVCCAGDLHPHAELSEIPCFNHETVCFN